MYESSPEPSSRYPHLDESIVENLRSKLRNFRALPEEKDNKLRVVVYGDYESVSYQMWNSIFRDDVNFRYTSELRPTPIPHRYSSRKYEQYEREAKKFVANYIRTRELDIIWDLYNVSTLAKYPRMHLLLANRRVKRSELERWAHVDRPSGLGLSVQADRPSSQSSPSSHAGGGSGVGSTRSSSGELCQRDSGDRSGTGDIEESIAGCSSAADGSSASLSSDNSGTHNDERFITIETLRSLVSTVLEDDSSSSESTQTPRVRQSPRLLQRSAGLPFDSEDAPVAAQLSIEQPD